jgi:hypothetical protein
MLPDKPCNDYAPDTFALDYGDGIDTTLFCTGCGYHKDDHLDRCRLQCVCSDEEKEFYN